MQIYTDCKNGMISNSDLIESMKFVENYVFIQAICGILTNSLNKMSATLVKEIDNEKYVESIIASLLLKEGYKRFPTYEEIRIQFPIVPLYNLRVVDYTLRKLENYIIEKSQYQLKIIL